jgi:predicted transcriptional regulator
MVRGGGAKMRMRSRSTTRTEELDFGRAVEVSHVVAGLRRYGLTGGDIAKVVGVTERSVRNWLRTSAADRRHEERIWTLRSVVLLLRESLTPRGVGQWLRAPNRLRGARRPIDVLSEGQIDAVREAAAAYVEGACV